MIDYTTHLREILEIKRSKYVKHVCSILINEQTERYLWHTIEVSSFTEAIRLFHNVVTAPAYISVFCNLVGAKVGEESLVHVFVNRPGHVGVTKTRSHVDRAIVTCRKESHFVLNLHIVESDLIHLQWNERVKDRCVHRHFSV